MLSPFAGRLERAPEGCHDRDQILLAAPMSVEPKFIRQGAALGAEVLGVDASRSVDDETAAALRHAFLEHQVLFFRDQRLAPPQTLAFAKHFGEPAEYPFAEGIPGCPLVTEIVKERHERINFGGEWHSDTTYLERPPRATLLYAVEVPAAGGDTLYSDMYRAYARRSPGMRRMLGRLRAVNTAGLLAREKRDGYASVRAKNVHRLDMRAEHPVVRTHPDTGRKALYVNETHTLHFRGMTREESLPLLTYLCREATRAENGFRLRWRPGTLAIWDNRCVQHYALNDYHGHRRVMHRVIVACDRPR